MHRPLVARIDLSALRHNLAVIRARVPDARIMAVIKADAYGHGMLRAARALDTADGFAVLNVEEGIALREAGHRQPVLMLEGFFSAEELAVAARHGISVVAHTDEQLAMLEAARLERPLDVFLKINTGMNRLGLRPEAVAPALDRLSACANVAAVTVMTHFACADEAGGADAQRTLFEALPVGHRPASLANSAAALLLPPRAPGDWVRPGIALYGASPDAAHEAADYGLRPVMTLASRVIAVQALAAGDAVGYGATFRAERPMRIGIVACGYADGYPRHAPTDTPVLIDGRPGRTLGRVSMDMLCVDLSDHPAAGIGTPVTLWGEGLPVERVAAAAGTISYELLAARMPRVPVVEVG